MEEAGGITQLLDKWRRGDEKALDRLMALIYEELRRIASSYLRRERADHTLQSRALVNEAFLRLADQQHVEWQNRAHFLGIAAQMMRRILANHARDRRCAKRGAGAEHLPLEEATVSSASAGAVDRFEQYLEIDEALDRLARIHTQQAKVVELRYFGGLSREEIAEVLGLSVPTVTRRWRVARAWLYDHLGGEVGDELR